MTLAPALAARRTEFLNRFPDAVHLERALRSVSNHDPFFYFADSTDSDLRGCSWVLGRLGPDIEKQFGIAGEVLLLFTPYDDLQRRVFNVLSERLKDEVAQQQMEAHGAVRFTPDPSVVLLASPDPQMRSNLESWNLVGSGALVAPLPVVDASTPDVRVEIIRGLRHVLIARDLYRGRNPVTGNDFFGRQDLLNLLRSELSAGRSIGLFGLRRSGKTSVIGEFRRRSRHAGIGVVLSDLESVVQMSDLPALLAADLTNLLRDLKETDASVWLGSETDQSVLTFAQLSSRIIRVAEKNRHYKFVVALDEIESLVPLVKRDPEQVRAFLGALRRAAQSTGNVAILATGVTTRFFDESMLADSVENPLFGSFDSHYLSPFSPEETANLVRKLGKAMVLEWDDDALQLLHSSVGGFPFLVRDLASAVRARAHQEQGTNAGIDPITITAPVVERTLQTWSETAARLWGEIVRTLEMHHPLMAEMVRATSDDQLGEWLDAGAEAQAAARALEGLGLLAREGELWGRAPALENLQSLGSTKVADPKQIREEIARRASAGLPVSELLGREEDPKVEFKETARFDVATNKVEDHITHSVLKTIAGFINTEGGTLLIGVRDGDKHPVGIARDIATLNQSPTLDGFTLWLNNQIKLAMGDIAASLARIGFDKVNDADICRVDVAPGKQLTSLTAKKGKDKNGNVLRDERVLYIRLGAESVVLAAADVRTRVRREAS